MNVTSSADTELGYGLGFGLALPLFLAATAGAAIWQARRCWWQQRWHLPRNQPKPEYHRPTPIKSNILEIVQNPQHLAELQAARQASVTVESQQVMVVKRTFAPTAPSR